MSNPQSPFKFLDAYGKDEMHSFFGRDQEIEALYSLVFQGKLILLYGASGVGKTSLIQCGLANKFHPTQWQELFIRRRDNINGSIREVVNKAIGESNPKGQTEIPEDLHDSLHLLYLYNFKPIYLIFDQFEELFIFGTEEEQIQFFEFVKKILSSELSCKILLSMREEYLAHLSEFEKIVPSIFDHRFRVERMNRKNLSEVIQKTADLYEIEIPKAESVIDQMLENLSDKRGVDLTNLQVYMDRLYREDQKRESFRREGPRFDKQLINSVGELKDVMGSFLEEQLGILESDLGKKDIPLDILFSLVSDEATKRSIEIDDIKESLYRRKNISAEDIDYCIQRFFELRIFKEVN
ncbi:MAG: ATP-binding protein [Bacteroidia bacterium]|nr:ATP-binding protein [Bacteroidia bacterium]